MSPRAVLREHSSAELTEWRAFDRAYGLGFAEDSRAGVIAASVWNAAGGIPEGGDRRRPAKPGDFFANLDLDGDGSDEPSPQSHDIDDGAVDAEVAAVDEMDEAEKVTQAMKNAFFIWGTRMNAAHRAAQQLDAGEPPSQPENN